MEIRLTDEQIQELIKSGNIRISAENESLKGFDIYLEFGNELGFEYGEICAPECATDSKDKNYVFDSNDLSLLKQEPPYHPHSWTEYVACPKCFTPMIYNYDHCPKCGKHIDWSKEGQTNE